MSDAQTNNNPTERDMNTITGNMSTGSLVIVINGWNYVITNRSTITAYSPNSIFRAVIG